MKELSRETFAEDSSVGSDSQFQLLWAGRLFTIIGILLAAATIWLFRGSTVDDAFISLRYVYNLLHTGALEFNPGERVEGFTCLGYVLMCALFSKITTIDPLTSARILGLFGAIIALIFGPLTVFPDAKKHFFERGLARLLLLSNFGFVFYSWTGMETSVATGVLSSAAYLFTRSTYRFTWSVGLLCGLAFLIRPELAALGIVCVCIATWRWGIRTLPRWTGAWVWVAVLTATEIWRWWYYGALAPNTSQVKSLFSVMAKGVPWYGTFGDDMVEFISGAGGPAALFFALCAVFIAGSRLKIAVIMAFCSVLVAFEIYAGGDWMLGYRYLQPMLPLYISVIVMGLVHLWKTQDFLFKSRPGFLISSLIVVLIACHCWSYTFSFYSNRDQYPNFVMTSYDMKRAALWMKDHYPPEYQVVCWRIGALAYFSHLRVIDNIGLTDQTIARAGQDSSRVTAYISSRKPQLLIRGERAAATAAASCVAYGSQYRLVRTFPQGSEQLWLLYERDDLPAGPQ